MASPFLMPELQKEAQHQHHHHHHHHHHKLPKAKEPVSGVLVHPWVCIDPSGSSSVVQEGRYKLMTELGIQGRDLRLLEEPPSGGTFLVREDAIIASLDFVCVIITTKAAYIVNPSEPGAIKFMNMLAQRLAFAAATASGEGGVKTWQEREQQLLLQAHAGGERQGPAYPPPPSQPPQPPQQPQQPQQQQQQQQQAGKHKHAHLHFPPWKHSVKPQPHQNGPNGLNGQQHQHPPLQQWWPVPVAGTPLQQQHQPSQGKAPPSPQAKQRGPPFLSRHSSPMSTAARAQEPSERATPFYGLGRHSLLPPQDAHASKQAGQGGAKGRQAQPLSNGKEQAHHGKGRYVPPKPFTMPVLQSTEPLPFELRVLEMCLYELVSGLVVAYVNVEAMALPLVDILINQAESAVLEGLRLAKKELANLTTKASRVCGLLKGLLDDDSDMWGMHLTAKETQRSAAQEAAARMMEEVNAMAEQATHKPTLEKVEEEEWEEVPRSAHAAHPNAQHPFPPSPAHHHHPHHHHAGRPTAMPQTLTPAHSAPHAPRAASPPRFTPFATGPPAATPFHAAPPATHAHVLHHACSVGEPLTPGAATTAAGAAAAAAAGARVAADGTPPAPHPTPASIPSSSRMPTLSPTQSATLSTLSTHSHAHHLAHHHHHHHHHHRRHSIYHVRVPRHHSTVHANSPVGSVHGGGVLPPAGFPHSGSNTLEEGVPPTSIGLSPAGSLRRDSGYPALGVGYAGSYTGEDDVPPTSIGIGGGGLGFARASTLSYARSSQGRDSAGAYAGASASSNSQDAFARPRALHREPGLGFSRGRASFERERERAREHSVVRSARGTSADSGSVRARARSLSPDAGARARWRQASGEHSAVVRSARRHSECGSFCQDHEEGGAALPPEPPSSTEPTEPLMTPASPTHAPSSSGAQGDVSTTASDSQGVPSRSATPQPPPSTSTNTSTGAHADVSTGNNTSATPSEGAHANSPPHTHTQHAHTTRNGSHNSNGSSADAAGFAHSRRASALGVGISARNNSAAVSDHTARDAAQHGASSLSQQHSGALPHATGLHTAQNGASSGGSGRLQRTASAMTAGTAMTSSSSHSQGGSPAAAGTATAGDSSTATGLPPPHHPPQPQQQHSRSASASGSPSARAAVRTATEGVAGAGVSSRAGERVDREEDEEDALTGEAVNLTLPPLPPTPPPPAPPPPMHPTLPFPPPHSMPPMQAQNLGQPEAAAAAHCAHHALPLQAASSPSLHAPPSPGSGCAPTPPRAVAAQPALRPPPPRPPTQHPPHSQPQPSFHFPPPPAPPIPPSPAPPPPFPFGRPSSRPLPINRGHAPHINDNSSSSGSRRPHADSSTTTSASNNENSSNTETSSSGYGGSGSRLSAQNLRMLAGSSPPRQGGVGLSSSPGNASSLRGMLGRKSVRGRSNPTRSGNSSSSSSSSGEFDHAVSQVEMLIESYYLQLDDAYNRLQTLADYIEDAEDMVHLHLNATQNVLLAHDLVFSIIAVINAVLFTIASFFTMNLNQGPYQEYPWFFDFFAPLITLGSWVVVGSLTVFLIYIYLYQVEKGRSWFWNLAFWKKLQ